MSPVVNALIAVHVALEVEQMLFHAYHWRSKGQDYYGDHLLYQRLYQARAEEIDRIGEVLMLLVEWLLLCRRVVILLLQKLHLLRHVVTRPASGPSGMMVLGLPIRIWFLWLWHLGKLVWVGVRSSWGIFLVVSSFIFLLLWHSLPGGLLMRVCVRLRVLRFVIGLFGWRGMVVLP